jgi:hypothetical protein
MLLLAVISSNEEVQSIPCSSSLRTSPNVGSCCSPSQSPLFASFVVSGMNSYFSSSSSIALSSWSTDASDTLTRCGHCDNCTRPPETLDKRDVTLDAWKILQVLENIKGEGGQVTVGMLSDLVRGAGGASFSVAQQGGGRKRKSGGKEKVGLDLDAIAGGKLSLSKDVSTI